MGLATIDGRRQSVAVLHEFLPARRYASAELAGEPSVLCLLNRGSTNLAFSHRHIMYLRLYEWRHVAQNAAYTPSRLIEQGSAQI